MVAISLSSCDCEEAREAKVAFVWVGCPADSGQSCTLKEEVQQATWGKGPVIQPSFSMPDEDPEPEPDHHQHHHPNLASQPEEARSEPPDSSLPAASGVSSASPEGENGALRSSGGRRRRARSHEVVEALVATPCGHASPFLLSGPVLEGVSQVAPAMPGERPVLTPAAKPPTSCGPPTTVSKAVPAVMGQLPVQPPVPGTASAGKAEGTEAAQALPGQLPAGMPVAESAIAAPGVDLVMPGEPLIPPSSSCQPPEAGRPPAGQLIAGDSSSGGSRVGRFPGALQDSNRNECQPAREGGNCPEPPESGSGSSQLEIAPNAESDESCDQASALRLGAAGRLYSQAVNDATGGKSAGIPKDQDTAAFITRAFSLIERENLNVDLDHLDALEKVCLENVYCVIVDEKGVFVVKYCAAWVLQRHLDGFRGFSPKFVLKEAVILRLIVKV